MTPHGYFHWNELATNDVEKAKAFYEETLGWKFTGMDMGPGGTYWLASADEMPVAGVYQMGDDFPEGAEDQWTSYIAVDDIDQRVAAAKKAGATVIQEPFDIPGTGKIAILSEPGGARVGWMTPNEQQ